LWQPFGSKKRGQPLEGLAPLPGSDLCPDRFFDSLDALQVLAYDLANCRFAISGFYKGKTMKTRFVSLLTALTVVFGAAVWASAETYKIDAVHSQVIFRIGHLGVSKIFGRFNTTEGTFVTDDDPSKISFEATVSVDSLDTGNPQRDKHLKSPDFFNAKQFPEITFKSTSVAKSGDTYQITGDLTLHGVTKSITVPMTKIGEAKTMAGERAGFGTEFTVKRSDYGMNFMPGAVGDDVELLINLEGVK
jgi:polyisoprenoid-binding protein YceI